MYGSCIGFLHAFTHFGISGTSQFQTAHFRPSGEILKLDGTQTDVTFTECNLSQIADEIPTMLMTS